MSTIENFDAIVIGSGQGGKPLSAALAKAGRKTALIERADVGGTCINTGCTPTKTMVASARVAYLARRGPDYGVLSGDVRIDLKKIRQRKRDIVLEFRGSSEKGIASQANLELIRGEAHFTSPNEIVVSATSGDRALTAANIFINTGVRQGKPDIPGIDSVPTLDNASLMELGEVPEHLVVLGGGYIGVEFGQMFRRFGSEVTIIHRGGQLLDREDEDVAAEVEKILRDEGIVIHLNTNTKKISASAGHILLDIESDAATSQAVTSKVQGTHLLIATGRVPNTEALNLNLAGIATDDHGYIRVNDRLETNVAGVFALGDVKGGPAFTHISYDDFRVLRDNLIDKKNDKKSASIAGRLVPYVVYMDPQLGGIGLTEKEAREQGKKIRIAKMQMTSVARALETAETRGFMKVIVDADSGQILGASILGVEGGEVVAMLELAMMGKLSYTVLQNAVFAHPAWAEALNNLFLHFEDEK